MNQETSHFAFNMAALIGLLGATIAFAAMGQMTLAGQALTAFIGFAAGARARTVAGEVASGVTAVGVAIAIGAALGGCAATMPQVASAAALVVDGVEWGCAGAIKACKTFDPDTRNGFCQFAESECGLIGAH